MSRIEEKKLPLLTESYEKLVFLRQIKNEINIAFEGKNRKRLKKIYQLLGTRINEWDTNKSIVLYPAETRISRIKKGLLHSADLFLDSNDIAFNVSPILAGLAVAGVITPVFALALIIGVVAAICLPSMLVKYNRVFAKAELKERTLKYTNDLEELVLANVSGQVPSLNLPEKYDENITPPEVRDRNMFLSSGFKYGFKQFALCIGLGTLLPNSILTIFGYTALAASISTGIGLLIVIGASAAIGIGIAAYFAYQYKKNSAEEVKEKTVACLKNISTEKRIESFKTNYDNAKYAQHVISSSSLFQAIKPENNAVYSDDTFLETTTNAPTKMAANAI